MSDRKLRASLIRLAHEKPELRSTLLPMLREAAGLGPEILSPKDVEKLPVGSIVYPWAGRPDGVALVVIPDGNLTQIALLPERADGEEPGGDPVDAWGREFALVAKGKGQLPTKGTAQRLAVNWIRTIGK